MKEKIDNNLILLIKKYSKKYLFKFKIFFNNIINYLKLFNIYKYHLINFIKGHY